MTAQKIRCAIYTRKSSEEGLEQAFNSLDAQREACAAYIQSQRHEGWLELPTLYDDGGISGGTMQRPALQQLLEDIQADRINTVVVYKVDRLTRSLADFSKIVDVFDAHGVSFVSVTQQFNTTTSMGRLTLNMLLSFAQFEREVTGERIRDKIAASKRKGMWMGGLPPLGYDAIDRQLQINAPEADSVRLIFRRYTELGAVDALRRDLLATGICNKVHIRKDGAEVGGGPLLRGALYRMLQNPLYRGRIRHRGQIYEGQHEAIIDEALWQAVQEKLDANRLADARQSNAKAPSLLAGKLQTDQDEPFTPSHANKNGKRYRYYVSRSASSEQDPVDRRWRIPAGDLERLTIITISGLLSDARQLRPILAGAGIPELEQLAALDRGAGWGNRLSETLTAEDRESLRAMLVRITIAERSITLAISITAVLQALGNQPTPDAAHQPHKIVLPVQLRRAGMEMRLVDERTAATSPDPTLVRLLIRAWTIRSEILKGDGRSLNAIAQDHGIGDSYVGRLLRLGFLAPDIVETILQGKQPPELTANRLTTLPSIPADWAEQRKMILGMPQRL